MKTFFNQGRVASLILVACMAGVVHAQSNESIVKDGGFDNAKEPTWKVEHGVGYKDGYMWLNGAGAQHTDPTASQVLNNLTVGAEYILSGRYRAGDTADKYAKVGHELFAISVGDAHREYLAPAKADDPKVIDKTWRSFYFPFKATATSETLSIKGEIKGRDADVAIDDISVVANAVESFRVHAFSIKGAPGDAGAYWISQKEDQDQPMTATQDQLGEKGKLIEIVKMPLGEATFAFKIANATNPEKGVFLTAMDDHSVGFTEATDNNIPEGAKFKVIPALYEPAAADQYCSIESVKFPGRYLRHFSFKLYVNNKEEAKNTQENYQRDATWRLEGVKPAQAAPAAP